MSKLRIHSYTVSLDGYGAGPDQSLDNPLGVGAESQHEWMIGTQTFQAMMGNAGGETGVDEDFTARGFDNIGAVLTVPPVLFERYLAAAEKVMSAAILNDHKPRPKTVAVDLLKIAGGPSGARWTISMRVPQGSVM